jgi:hypothetical protein
MMLYFASGLGLGNHTVTIANKPSGLSSVLDIDYVQIIGGVDPASLNGSTSKSKRSVKPDLSAHDAYSIPRPSM